MRRHTIRQDHVAGSSTNAKPLSLAFALLRFNRQLLQQPGGQQENVLAFRLHSLESQARPDRFYKTPIHCRREILFAWTRQQVVNELMPAEAPQCSDTSSRW